MASRIVGAAVTLYPEMVFRTPFASTVKISCAVDITQQEQASFVVSLLAVHLTRVLFLSSPLVVYEQICVPRVELCRTVLSMLSL